jgi:hypothetical protein
MYLSNLALRLIVTRRTMQVMDGKLKNRDKNGFRLLNLQIS